MRNHHTKKSPRPRPAGRSPRAPRQVVTGEALESRRMLAAQMVGDFTTGTPGGGPGGLTALNGSVYFFADDGVYGRELWKTDGTAAGTMMVKDIRPGAASSISTSWLTDFNGRLFFMANDGVNGTELWRTDGTAQGTVMVKDINPGQASSEPGARQHETDFIRLVVGDTLYFRATDARGNELWKTDGTRAGTVMVTEINKSVGSSLINNFVEYQGDLLFTANDSIVTRVYRTDGTAAGTKLVGGGSNPYDLVRSGGYVYFHDYFSAGTKTLWRTDGTQAGTTAVGEAPGTIDNLVDVNGRLFFVSSTTPGTPRLYTRDPVTGAIGPVSTAPDAPYRPEFLTPFNGLLYFRAGGGGPGALWRSDGTQAGTQIVSNAQPDGTGGFKQEFVRYGTDQFLFFGTPAAGGPRALWKSDGTTAGTTPFAALNLNPYYGLERPDICPLGQTVFLAANTPDSGSELWKTDGTPAGTVLVKDINQAGYGSNPIPGIDYNGTLYFAGAGGYALWRSDGTTAGTRPATELVGASGSPGSPRGWLVANDLLYFSATYSGGGSSPVLWRTNGTAAGTFPLRPTNVNIDTPQQVTAVNGRVFFRAWSNGWSLWTTDGTIVGTTPVKDPLTGQNVSNPDNLRALGGRLYFTADSTIYGRELWTTDGTADGTAAGTALLKDLLPGKDPSNAREFTVAGDTLYFLADGGEGTAWLWKSDGTAQGTVRLLSLTDRLASSLTAANGLLFFLRSDPDTGRELWQTDGTPAGTRIVRDIVPGPGSSKIKGLLTVGNTLFFQANDATHGPELWRTDGTPAGTGLVADLFPGLDGGNPTPVFDANGLLIFTATDADHGTELWRSDGTPAGTFLVDDVRPGTFGSSPANFAIAAGVLYFSASDGAHGAELWKVTDIPQPLRAEAGALYTVREGEAVTLTSAGSTGAIAAYEWDFDYDPAVGFEIDATGPSATFAGLDGPSLHTVALRVRTDTGVTHIDTTQVRVDNVAPTATATAPATVTAGTPYVLNLSYADPGQDAAQSWRIEWGDGTVQTVTGNPASVSHVYATPGWRSIHARVTDDDGTYAVTVPGVPVGGLDTSFSQDGIVQAPAPVSDVVVLPDGAILSLAQNWTIQKYLPDGTPDPSFGGGDGKIVPGLDAPARDYSSAASLVVAPDGDIIVVGTFNNPTYVYEAPVVARFNANGSVDAAFSFPGPFDNNPFSTNTATSVALAPDGKILITGRHRGGPDNARFGLAVMRLHPNGTPDDSFGTGGQSLLNLLYHDHEALAAKQLADGRIVVGASVGGESNARFAALRLTPTGALDPTFGPGGGGLVTVGISTTTQPADFAFQDDGKIVAVGRTGVWSWPYHFQPAVVRFTADGLLDPSFGQGGIVTQPLGSDAAATSVVIDPTGRIVVGGRSDSKLALLRYLPDGTPDADFGTAGQTLNSVPDADGFPARLALQPDGRIVAAATSATTGGTHWIARFVQSPLSVHVTVPPPALANPTRPAPAYRPAPPPPPLTRQLAPVERATHRPLGKDLPTSASVPTATFSVQRIAARKDVSELLG